MALLDYQQWAMMRILPDHFELDHSPKKLTVNGAFWARPKSRGCLQKKKTNGVFKIMSVPQNLFFYGLETMIHGSKHLLLVTIQKMGIAFRNPITAPKRGLAFPT
jgi:hypothetical protein